MHYGVTHTDIALARQAILNEINAGKLIVNFIGHGYTNGWASPSLFTTASLSSLSNGDLQPVVLAMTCKEGYYINPDLYAVGNEALAEVVTRAQGKGAVASWSPTGLGIATGHDYLDRGFFNALFKDGVFTIGLATARGKLDLFATGANLDLLDTYLLFGDPALHIPLKPTAVESALVHRNSG